MLLFTREAAVGITRTVVAFFYAWLITKIPGVKTWVADNGFDVATLSVVLGGVLYTLIRQLAEKWSWLGYVLVFNTKPTYSSDSSS